jgi:glycerophosphoryl diester phosphodiesterase
LRRLSKGLIAAAVVLVSFTYLNNTSSFAPARTGTPTVLVHRGMAQRFDSARTDGGGCEAAHMLPPKHAYLENTIPSIQAAFDRGADVVEFDIQLTREGRFAVFHDRRLECRTNGSGFVREHTLAQLKALDVGYGYTSDGGRSFPFRGKGVGLITSLDDVLETFPGRSFLIDIKGNNSGDGALLAARLSKLSEEHRVRLMVFGNDSTLASLREGLPDVRSFSTASIQNCLLRYIAYGWTGAVPASCQDSPVFVPINVAPFLWGWPNRFMDRMHANGSSIVVLGEFGSREISPGLDTLEDFARLPASYDGGIWTNDVELIRSALGR